MKKKSIKFVENRHSVNDADFAVPQLLGKHLKNSKNVVFNALTRQRLESITYPRVFDRITFF